MKPEILHPANTPEALALAETLEAQVEQTNNEEDKDKPLWYLAYGSNLNSRVFRGRRGIQPLAARNVLAPGLQLAFNLPGVPYIEPRFANCRVLAHDSKASDGAPAAVAAELGGEKQEQLGGPAVVGDAPDARNASANVDEERETAEVVRRLREGPWTGDERALIGVAYLVTKADFERILATEGGGASYEMVAVDSKVLAPEPERKDGDSEDTADELFTGEVVRAFTLVAPSTKTRQVPGESSLRYLNLIRTGAEEHALPRAYRSYLETLRPYASRTLGQKAGRALVLALWAPPLLALILVGFLVPNESGGRAPTWLLAMRETLFKSMWTTHDRVWKQRFGDGEHDALNDDKGAKGAKTRKS